MREERTPPLSIGGDAGAGKINPFAFPIGPFTLGVEVFDAPGATLGRRDVSLVGQPGATPVPPLIPPPVVLPDVAGAVTAAIAARALLPGDPVGALAKVEQVIDLLT